jgi:hypothetical protein
MRAAAESWPGGETRLSASIGRWRQGGLRIDQRPANGPNDDADLAFPAITADRPEVQTALIADVRAERFTMPIAVSLQLQLARIENARNVSGAAALYVRATVTGSYAFRYP